MSKRILIIEDDFDLSRQWNKLLQSHGYQVDLSYTAQEAIIVLNNDKFDLIILDRAIFIHTDLNNSHGIISDGAEAFFKYLRETDQAHIKAIPIIGVSGFKVRGSIKRTQRYFLDHQVAEFLEKPIRPSALLNAVKNCLGNN